MQATYASAPLYRFAADKAPGDTNGQGVGGIWFVMTASGSPAAATAGASATTAVTPATTPARTATTRSCAYPPCM